MEYKIIGVFEQIMSKEVEHSKNMDKHSKILSGHTEMLSTLEDIHIECKRQWACSKTYNYPFTTFFTHPG